MCFDSISVVNMNMRRDCESDDSLTHGTYCKVNCQHTKQMMLIHELRCTLQRGVY